MEKNYFEQALKKAKQSSKKRKFNQSVDLIITFKNLDLKKPDNQLDSSVSLHYSTGKKIMVCGLVGPELLEEAKKELDLAISIDEFHKYENNKKAIKKLAKQYDYFIAQSTIMPKIAQVFGRVFGPRQKMPNPKMGCVVAPNQSVKPVYEILQKTAKISVKTIPQFQSRIGLEDQKEEEVIDNALNIYNHIIRHLPGEEQNVKNVYIKLTMGPPVKVREETEEKKKK